jgi:hypothetical protein
LEMRCRRDSSESEEEIEGTELESTEKADSGRLLERCVSEVSGMRLGRSGMERISRTTSRKAATYSGRDWA